MATDLGYYDKFESLTEKYMPIRGEGETVASQIVTAVNKLIYKWYNDGDVFDNTGHLTGWANDLSDYANWLYKFTTKETKEILNKVFDCQTDGEYEDLLQELTDHLFKEDFLEIQNKIEKIDTIYDCTGKFEYVELSDEEYY